MRPSLPFNNLLNSHKADSVLLRQRAIARSPSVSFVSSSNFFNVILSKLGRCSLFPTQDGLWVNTHPVSIAKGVSLGAGISSMTLTARHPFWMRPASMAFASRCPPLLMPIRSVFCIGSLKQVGRIATRWVVAMVTYIKVAGIRFVKEKVGNAMGEQLVFLDTDCGRPVAVAILIAPAVPRPAFQRRVARYLIVEPFNLLLRKVRKNTIKISHAVHSFVVNGLVRPAQSLTRLCGPFCVNEL